LERAWKAAEEIAAISDDLLVSPNVDSFLKEHAPRQANDSGDSDS